MVGKVIPLNKPNYIYIYKDNRKLGMEMDVANNENALAKGLHRLS